MTQITDEELSSQIAYYDGMAETFDDRHGAFFKSTADALRELQEFRQIRRVLREQLGEVPPAES